MANRDCYGWTSSEATPAHAYVVPVVLECLPPGRLRIVDLGCGNGYTAAELAKLGHSVVGVEPSSDGVELARRAHPSVSFERASLYEDLVSVVGTGFDVVLSTEVIEHLERPRELFRAALSVLRPGGTLIVTTPYHGYVKNLALALTGKLDDHFHVGWDGGHIKFFSVKTLGAMATECGFRNLRWRFAGRTWLLWKSMVLAGVKPTP